MQNLNLSFLFLIVILYSCKVQEPQTPKSSAKEIASATFPIPNTTSSFNAATNTYTYTVPAGSSLTAIAFNFTLSSGATSVPAPGTTQDFTNPVKYTITAEDGSKSVITVVVNIQQAPKSSEKQILNFAFNSLTPVVQASIDHENKKITAKVPSTTDFTKLTPTITLSPKATISPNSGVVQNFANPVNYIVTAEDGSTQAYQVTISKDVISQANELVFISAAGKLFAIDAKTGIKMWESNEPGHTSLVRSPTIHDGKILGGASGFFVALNLTDGKYLWSTKQYIGNGFQSPVIYNNKILVNSHSDLFVIDPNNGNIDNLKNGDVYTPIMVHNDKVYYGGSTTSLGYLAYCFDLKTNQILWKTETYRDDDRQGLIGNPVYHKNNVIFENGTGTLFCFDADKGELIWKTSGKVSDKFYNTYSSPTVEGDMVFSTNGRFILATNAITGKRTWEFDTNLSARLEENSPVFGEGLVFSAFNNTLFAVNAENGTKKWGTEIGRLNKPPVYFDGIVYIGCTDNHLYAINAKTGEIVWKFNSQGLPDSYPIVLDKNGKVHFSSLSGNKN